jgi:hypothetical protein
MTENSHDNAWQWWVGVHHSIDINAASRPR